MFSKFKNLINKKKTSPCTELCSSTGFTLVELMVSVSVFAWIMVISIGAITTIIDSNRKSQNMRAVMDNLNSTMESMTRTIRFGTNYHCGPSGTLSDPFDCSLVGNSSITIKDSSNKQITYYKSGSKIMKYDGTYDYELTSGEVVITSLDFKVSGSSMSDELQPKVIIVVKGYVGAKENTKSTFTLQTTVSQREFDYR